MGNLLNWISNIPFKNTIISGIIGAAITYIFTIFKMKKDRNIEFEKAIGYEIANSLFDVRNAIKELNTFEIYDFDNSFKENANNPNLDGFQNYPVIFNNADTLLNFFIKINDVRKDHELYLSYRSSAYLLYMSDYLLKLLQFLGQFEEVDFNLVGVVLNSDIENWQKSFDKQIVKELNTNKLKLTSKTGEKWKSEIRKVNSRFWDESFLRKMIEKIGSNPTNINIQIMEMVSG